MNIAVFLNNKSVTKKMTFISHCALSKTKMNGKKLSKLQFHFPGLLVTFPIIKYDMKQKSIIGHWRYSHLSKMDKTLKQSWITKENEH